MRLPFVLRSTHEKEIAELQRQKDTLERLLTTADRRVTNLNIALQHERARRRVATKQTP